MSKRKREDNLRHDSSHQRHAVYMRHAREKEKRIEDPNRDEWLLRQAVDRVGLEVVGYEHFDYPYNYDVAVRINGQLAYIDIKHLRRGYLPPRDQRVLNRKIALCEAAGIPLCIVIPGSVVEMQAQIDVWSMFI